MEELKLPDPDAALRMCTACQAVDIMPTMCDRQILAGIDASVLSVMLSEALEQRVDIINAIDLASSSRSAPWRLDVTIDGEEQRFVLRLGESVSPNEVMALMAMSDHPLPTPRVVLWEASDPTLGLPLFVSEFIEGAPLLPAMKEQDRWAIDLFLDTVLALQAIRVEDLREDYVNQISAGETMDDIIESAYQRFGDPDPVHSAAYRQLIESRPPKLPEPAFSNGDLWPENILIQGRELVGIVDWQHAGWSDPVWEFLLTFFLVPELRHRGIEEGYLSRMGCDPSLLGWYHGVEYFDSLSHVLETGDPYGIHTADSLTLDLRRWLDG